MTHAYAPFPPGTQPAYDVPSYGSTQRRAPHQPLVALPAARPAIEHTGPVFAPHQFPTAIDLSRENGRDAMGQRIIVAGRVTDEDGRPVPHTMIEIWQANAAGRYRHRDDRWPAPLDPNFSGGGRTVTDADGRYAFTTIKPGPYPWGNHANAWRPAHIHFSLLGRTFEQRLVTQMYFPGDPLFDFDPIFQSVRDPQARERLIASFSMDRSQENWALHYDFDIALGERGTPFE
jgi:protocatechuate 3,4-dioxygenase beta subunit